MTKKWRSIWTFIQKYRAREGAPPSTTLIAEKLQITRQSVYDALDRMTKHGYLRRVDSVGNYVETNECQE